MTTRITSALFTLARMLGLSVCVAVAGCATVTPDIGQDAQSATTVGRLGNSDRDNTGGARARPQNKAAGASERPLPKIEISPAHFPQAIDLTAEAKDLFQRIRNGFSMPNINNDLVLTHQQWYLNRPDYLRRMVERSSLYMHYIVEELEKRGMPTELAFLPMVESAYNPMAYSRAKASGLWQFIPATGKRYKLDQTWWKDERRDVLASTTAALDYLQSIYEMHGDWHLALASYNWGEGAVGRAVNKNLAQGLPTDYLSLTMPGETRNYVPKLQALKNIFGNAALVEQLELLKIPNRPFFATVTQNANIDVTLAARLAEMSTQEFVALNPSHNRPVIMADTPLVIPAEQLDTFIANLKDYQNSNKPLSSWQSYTLQRGDSLDKVARRFGMSVAGLRTANGLMGRNTAAPGTTLLVASKGGASPLDSATNVEPPRTEASRTATTAKNGARVNAPRKEQALAKNARTADKVGKADPRPIEQAQRAKKVPRVTRYTVRTGDTLSSIARHFKVAVADLLRWNQLKSTGLVAGKTLTIQLAQNP